MDDDDDDDGGQTGERFSQALIICILRYVTLRYVTLRYVTLRSPSLKVIKYKLTFTVIINQLTSNTNKQNQFMNYFYSEHTEKQKH